MICDRRVALLVRVCFTLLVLTGLLSHTGILSGAFNPPTLMYYTIQSNVLALVLFAGLTVRTFVGLRSEGPKGLSSYAPRFELVVTIDLLLTLVAYWTMLAPISFSMVGTTYLVSFDNFMVHLVTPLFCLIDWVLFARPGSAKRVDILASLVFPFCYIIFATIAGALGYVFRIAPDGTPVRSPYFFIDFANLGWTALLYIAGLAAFFLVLGYLLYRFNQRGKASRSIKRSVE